MQWKYTAAVFWLAGFCALAAQAGPLTFEVASIKPSAPAGAGPVPMGIQLMPGGGFRASNVTLHVLLTVAYDVRDFQLSGGPTWLNTQMYDIQARSEHEPDTPTSSEAMRNMTDEQRKTLNEQIRERLRNLLADRFQLVVHRETKDQPVYLLQVAKGGPKFDEAKSASPAAGRMRMGRGELNGEATPMDFIAQVLSNQVRRPVLDKTGLTSKYDIHLTWAPDGPQGLPFGPLPAGVEPPPPPDPNGPTIFTALQEQLGLKLEPDKGPVDMIVIDRVERASEN